MDKTEIIMIIGAAAGFGAIMGPTGLLFTAVAAGIWWFFREFRREYITKKYNKVSGNYTFPLAVPGFGDLFCDITYDTVSARYEIRAIRHKHNNTDIFDNIPKEHTEIINRQLSDFITKIREKGGVSVAYFDNF